MKLGEKNDGALKEETKSLLDTQKMRLYSYLAFQSVTAFLCYVWRRDEQIKLYLHTSNFYEVLILEKIHIFEKKFVCFDR